jgi:hypothetical protein
MRALTSFTACTGALALLASAPAAAAARTVTAPSYSPWAALSAVASPASSQALCGSAAAGAAVAAAQAGAAPGCVLPAVDAPPVVNPPPAGPLGTPAATVAGGGIGLVPLLLGLAALGGLAALLLAGGGNDNDEIGISPR